MFVHCANNPLWWLVVPLGALADHRSCVARQGRVRAGHSQRCGLGRCCLLAGLVPALWLIELLG